MDQKVIIQSKVRVMWEGWVGGAGEDTFVCAEWGGAGVAWKNLEVLENLFLCSLCERGTLHSNTSGHY